MAFIGFRCPDALAAKVHAAAADRGGVSRYLRGLAEGALELAPAAPLAPRGRSTKLSLRLGEREAAQLDAVAAEAGLRRTEYVTALIRRRLTRRPTFDRRSAESLLEIRRELRRLGENFRELAGRGGGEGVTAAELEALRREVRGHVEQVRAVLEGSLAYWDEAA